MDKGLKAGRYRHYKGQDYYVYGTAKHSETEEILVVYRTEYADKSHWVRPLSMFAETIEINGQLKPRFKWIDEE